MLCINWNYYILIVELTICILILIAGYAQNDDDSTM